jgi:hypothetical protein
LHCTSTRRSSDPAFEFIADHSRAAANIAFLHWTAAGGIERMKSVFGLHMESVNVIEPSVPGFSNHRQRPEVALHIGCALLHFPRDHRVSHHPHAVSVSDHYRPVEQARIFHPGGAGHLAIAVFGEPSGKNSLF